MPAQERSPRPAGKPTIAGEVEARLRHDILHGLLAPGARLNLETLRDELDVGLSPLREAVTRLVSDGLIDVAAQRGYSVAPISAANYREISALRIELEPLALRLSIGQGGLDWESEVMAALHRLTRTERRDGDVSSLTAWEAENNAFHLVLISRCGMPLLLRILRGLIAMNDRYRLIFLKAAGRQRDVAAEHAAIARAAIDRRPDEAAALLAEHIRQSGEALLRLIGDDLPGGTPS